MEILFRSYISKLLHTKKFQEFKSFYGLKVKKFKKSDSRSPKEFNYLTWLEKAFVIYRCQRYDLQGKSVLKTQEKFYLADASLKYCMMGFNPTSIAAMLENIVYFELRRRGYEVYSKR